MSLRDEIKKADAASRKITPVPVPEWDGLTVYVKIMHGGQREKLEDAIINKRPYRSLLFAATVCDADGNNQYSEADYNELASLNGNAVERILTEAYRLNTLSKEAMTEVGEGSPTAL